MIDSVDAELSVTLETMLQDVLLAEDLVSENDNDRQPDPSQDTDVEDDELTPRPPKKKSWSDHAGQDGHQGEHEDFQTPLTLRRSKIAKQAFGSEESTLSELSEEGTDNGKGKGKGRKNWTANGKAKVNHKFASSFKYVFLCATLGNRLCGRFVSHQLQIILMSNLPSHDQGFRDRQQCQ